MFESLKHYRKRWSAWVGDRELELAIRSEISKSGYFGRSAKFHNVKLVAVQRPGWVQIYRFEVTARPVAENKTETQWLLGLVRDDGRTGSKVRLFENPTDRKAVFADWSADLICLRGSSGLL